MEPTKLRSTLVLALLPLALLACEGGTGGTPEGTAAAGPGGRDQIRVVGSSTVYPFTTTVAEHFGRAGGFPTPIVESTGTGGGFKLLCAGVGADHPDVANASRAIKESEVRSCADNGVGEVIELPIGYDGIVVANSRDAAPLTVTRRQLFLALARQVPQGEAAGKLVANPYRTWDQIDPALPAQEIEVLGPPPTSGTRDAFVELVMEEGCQSWDWVAELADSDEARYQAICHQVREDGAFVEAGENDNLIVQKLLANPDALGVFGYSFLEENGDRLQGARIDGVEPTFEHIADGSYPVSRPLFLYVKKAHAGLVPGLAELVAEYVSDRAIGEDGYLPAIGLVPLPPDELARVRRSAAELTAAGG